jgi:hypothetical protein
LGKLPKLSKKAKISTSNLNFEVQNIYIKPLLKPKMPTTKHVLKQHNYVKNVKNTLVKSGQNVTILGDFVSKKLMGLKYPNWQRIN